MSETLRLVRAYPRLPPRPGGMEQHIAALTAHQRALGVEVVALHQSGDSPPPARRVLAGRDLDRLRPAALRAGLFYAAAALDPPPGAALHIHGDWADFLAARALAARMGGPLRCATVHDRLRRSPRLYARALAGYDLVLATGAREARMLTEALGRRALHMPSAPHEAFFAPQPARPREVDVAIVANFVPAKRLALTVEVAARLPERRFVIYGDGPEAARLRAAAAGLSNLSFPGRLDRAGVVAALSGAKLFLSTSAEEGAPTAALEAMACGAPPLLTPSNEYRWLVGDAARGVALAGWSAEEIAARIEALLGDPARLAEMAEAARGFAATHRWPAKAAALTAAMRAALELRRERRCAFMC